MTTYIHCPRCYKSSKTTNKIYYYINGNDKYYYCEYCELKWFEDTIFSELYNLNVELSIKIMRNKGLSLKETEQLNKTLGNIIKKYRDGDL